MPHMEGIVLPQTATDRVLSRQSPAGFPRDLW